MSNNNDIDLQSVVPPLMSFNNSPASCGELREDGASGDYERLLGTSDKELLNASWRPGFWVRFPILAISSLVGVLASTVASVHILVSSHRQPLDKWGYGIAPSVYLAVASIVANMLLAHALANGLIISFWRTALRGRTLAELNQNWLCGQSLLHALVYGFRVGGRTTACACIFSAISLLRGPLNQRASAVRGDVSYSTAGTIPLAMAQHLPEGYTGIARHNRTPIMEIERLTPAFTQIMHEYSVRSNISIQHYDCGSICTATVKGFGFKAMCDVDEFVQYQTGIPYDQEIFVTSTALYQIGELDYSKKYWLDAGIRLNATYNIPLRGDENSSLERLPTRLRSHICNVTGGIVEYNLQIYPQSVTLSSKRSDDQFLEDIVLPGPGTYWHDSTIGGFEFAASYLFTSSAIFHSAGAVSSSTFTGSLANEMVQGDTENPSMFQDPMDNMLDAMREIAFRTSVRAGMDYGNITNATYRQEIEYHGSAKHSIYITDFRYMAAAALVSILGIFFVGLTLYGWWELGRVVSLSPLEIAKAFDAPLLAHAGSNVDLSDNKNLGLVGTTRVQYGGYVNEDISVKENREESTDVQRRKLVMGLSGKVKKPIAGETYGF